MDELTPLEQLLQRIKLGQEYPDAHTAVVLANKLIPEEANQLADDYDNM